MKAPGYLTTVAIATLATVVLAAVAFALASPGASGPDDAALPVITTGVSQSAQPSSTATDTVPATATPLPPATGTAAPMHDDDTDHDGDDDHETVVPEVRVEDHADDAHNDAHDQPESEHLDDGESSKQHSDENESHD